MTATRQPITGGGFDPIHRLAVRGRPTGLHPAERWLIHDGFVRPAAAGFELTAAGYRHHRRLLEAERVTIDVAALELLTGAGAGLARRLAALRRSAGVTAARPSGGVLVGLFAFANAAETLFGQLGAVLPRLGEYAPSLRAAARRLGAGDLRYGLSDEVESIATVWEDGYEDLLQTVGRGREAAEL